MHADQIELVRWTVAAAELALAVLVVRLVLAIALAGAARVLATSAAGAARRSAAMAERIGPRMTRTLVAGVAGAGILVAAPGIAAAAEPLPHGIDLPVLDRVVAPPHGDGAERADGSEPSTPPTTRANPDEPDALTSWRADRRQTPTRTPTHTPAPAPPPPPGGLEESSGTAGAPSVVTVVRGDTLWQIAARELGADATPTDVAQAWPRWHRANRELIGADPDRLVPGQRLHAPSTD